MPEKQKLVQGAECDYSCEDECAQQEPRERSRNLQGDDRYASEASKRRGDRVEDHDSDVGGYLGLECGAACREDKHDGREPSQGKGNLGKTDQRTSGIHLGSLLPNGPGAQLRGSRPWPPGAPTFRCRTLSRFDCAYASHGSCSASLGGGLAEKYDKAEKEETERWRPKNTQSVHEMDRTAHNCD